MDPKFDIFDNFFENADFAKIIVFPKENCYFSGFEPPKFNQKSMQKRYQKKHRTKELENRISASMLASQNLENRPEKRRRTKLVARRYGNHPGLGKKQRKASFVKRPNGYAYD